LILLVLLKKVIGSIGIAHIQTNRLTGEQNSEGELRCSSATYAPHPRSLFLFIFSQARHFFFGAAAAVAPKKPPFISLFSEAEESITWTNRSVVQSRGNEVLARNKVAL